MKKSPVTPENETCSVNLKFYKHKYNGEVDERCKKWKKQRLKRGFADCDVWNLDNYFTHVIPDSLDRLADTACGYCGQFKSMKEWQRYLRSIATDIRTADKLANDPKKCDEAHNLLRSAFARLANVYWSLWD